MAKKKEETLQVTEEALTQENTEPQIEDTIPEYADSILRMYPTYQSLYIDARGGTFTSEQPNTKLYNNPYYNE